MGDSGRGGIFGGDVTEDGAGRVNWRREIRSLSAVLTDPTLPLLRRESDRKTHRKLTRWLVGWLVGWFGAMLSPCAVFQRGISSCC